MIEVKNKTFAKFFAYKIIFKNYIKWFIKLWNVLENYLRKLFKKLFWKMIYKMILENYFGKWFIKLFRKLGNESFLIYFFSDKKKMTVNKEIHKNCDFHWLECFLNDPHCIPILALNQSIIWLYSRYYSIIFD